MELWNDAILGDVGLWKSSYMTTEHDLGRTEMCLNQNARSFLTLNLFILVSLVEEAEMKRQP